MTCIVGLVGKNGVLIAGDSQASGEYTKREDVSAKVFALSDVLAVGYCGSGRFGQILQYHLSDLLEDPPLGMDEHRWTVRHLVPHLRDHTEAHGHLHVHHNVEEFGPSGFLLAVRGRLFTVWSDFGVDEHVLPFEAIGSGGETAAGTLHGDLGENLGPIDDNRLEDVAARAINAAAKLTLHVNGTIDSVKTLRYTAAEKALAKRIVSGK